MGTKVILLILSVPIICYALEGGLKVRVTKKGLEYAGKRLIDEISNKLTTTPIPDQHGKKGKTSYSITNLKLNHFTQPKLTYQGKTGNAFTMHMNGAGINGGGNWRYKIKKWIFKISDHGAIRVTVRGINIKVHATMGLANSQPTIVANSVDCSISSIKIKVKSKIGWLYNLIIGIYKKKIRKMIQNEVRKAIKNAINKKVNQSLKTLNQRVKVMGGLYLNYGLTSPPLFAVDHIEASMAGTFLPQDTNANVPNMVLNTRRMLSLAISEESFNNFANAAYSQNLLKFVYADKKNIQSILPEGAGKEDPSLSYKVTVSAKESPKFNITTNKISCALTAKVILDASSGTDTTRFLDADISTTPTFTISVVGDLVKLQVISIPFEVKLADTGTSLLDGDKLEEAINSIMEWLLPQINEEAAKGFKLPSMKKVPIKNAAISINNGYVDVSSDFTIAFI